MKVLQKSELFLGIAQIPYMHVLHEASPQVCSAAGLPFHDSNVQMQQPKPYSPLVVPCPTSGSLACQL